MASAFNRRTLLRGMVHGSAVTIALPLLNCFLDGNGAALASGAPRPVRFGTWFWGCGINPSNWVPKAVGTNFALSNELKPIESVRQYVNVLSNYRVLTNGRPNLCHYTGWVGLRCGLAPAKASALPAETIDVILADEIGSGTRFRSIELSAMGNARHTYSARSETAFNPPEISPIGLYQRIFGPEFQDPNAASFTPDKRVMVRKSVLSGVLKEKDELLRTLGQADRARMDEYFTSIRQLEAQLELQLQRPPPAEACRVPPANGVARAATAAVTEIGAVGANHKLMAELLAMALACNQTRIFNMVFSDSSSGLTMQGHAPTQHVTTHEELFDEKLGYQVNNGKFVMAAMEGWATFETLAAIPEGDGTLLDQTLVFAHSDQELAKIHSLQGIPMMTAGRAGGHLKTGYHINGDGVAGSAVGLTMMRAMGMSRGEWGADEMRTSRVISELLV